MLVRVFSLLMSLFLLCLMTDRATIQADEQKPSAATPTLRARKRAPESKPSPTKSDRSLNEGRSSDKDENAPPPVSVVLLQKAVAILTEKMLAEKIDKAWGIDLSGGDEKSEDFVIKGGPGFVIRTKDIQYIIMIGKEPYLDEAAANEVDEVRLKTALKKHRTWLSVDLLSGDKELSEPERVQAWKRVATLAAELLDVNTVAIIMPEPGIAVAASDNTAELLRQKDPVAALRNSLNVPVVKASSADPDMEQAVEEARQTWPDFVRAYQKKEAGTESFSVKFAFDAPEDKELMWVEVTSIDDEFVTGRLANDPVWVKDLKLGSKVRRQVSEVSDWMYLRDGRMVGGYSVQVLIKRRQAEEKQEEQTTPR
ncbi:MAG: YegJ family protein [Planctomycetota bacterium]